MTVLPVMSLCSPLELPWLADSTEYSLWTLDGRILTADGLERQGSEIPATAGFAWQEAGVLRRRASPWHGSGLGPGPTGP